jgi:hypothetical protein
MIQYQIDHIIVHDYTSNIYNLNDSIINLQSQIDNIAVPECIIEINRINIQQSTLSQAITELQDLMDMTTVLI